MRSITHNNVAVMNKTVELILTVTYVILYLYSVKILSLCFEYV